MRKTKLNRVISGVLALLMVNSCVPSVFAADLTSALQGNSVAMGTISVADYLYDTHGVPYIALTEGESLTLNIGNSTLNYGNSTLPADAVLQLSDSEIRGRYYLNTVGKSTSFDELSDLWFDFVAYSTVIGDMTRLPMSVDEATANGLKTFMPADHGRYFTTNISENWSLADIYFYVLEYMYQLHTTPIYSTKNKASDVALDNIKESLQAQQAMYQKVVGLHGDRLIQRYARLDMYKLPIDESNSEFTAIKAINKELTDATAAFNTYAENAPADYEDDPEYQKLYKALEDAQNKSAEVEKATSKRAELKNALAEYSELMAEAEAAGNTATLTSLQEKYDETFELYKKTHQEVADLLGITCSEFTDELDYDTIRANCAQLGENSEAAPYLAVRDALMTQYDVSSLGFELDTEKSTMTLKEILDFYYDGLLRAIDEIGMLNAHKSSLDPISKADFVASVSNSQDTGAITNKYLTWSETITTAGGSFSLYNDIQNWSVYKDFLSLEKLNDFGFSVVMTEDTLTDIENFVEDFDDYYRTCLKFEAIFKDFNTRYKSYSAEVRDTFANVVRASTSYVDFEDALRVGELPSELGSNFTRMRNTLNGEWSQNFTADGAVTQAEVTPFVPLWFAQNNDFAADYMRGENVLFNGVHPEERAVDNDELKSKGYEATESEWKKDSITVNIHYQHNGVGSESFLTKKFDTTAEFESFMNDRENGLFGAINKYIADEIIALSQTLSENKADVLMTFQGVMETCDSDIERNRVNVAYTNYLKEQCGFTEDCKFVVEVTHNYSVDANISGASVDSIQNAANKLMYSQFSGGEPVETSNATLIAQIPEYSLAEYYETISDMPTVREYIESHQSSKNTVIFEKLKEITNTVEGAVVVPMAVEIAPTWDTRMKQVGVVSKRYYDTGWTVKDPTYTTYITNTSASTIKHIFNLVGTDLGDELFDHDVLHRISWAGDTSEETVYAPNTKGIWSEGKATNQSQSYAASAQAWSTVDYKTPSYTGLERLAAAIDAITASDLQAITHTRDAQRDFRVQVSDVMTPNLVWDFAEVFDVANFKDTNNVYASTLPPTLNGLASNPAYSVDYYLWVSKSTSKDGIYTADWVPNNELSDAFDGLIHSTNTSMGTASTVKQSDINKSDEDGGSAIVDDTRVDSDKIETAGTTTEGTFADYLLSKYLKATPYYYCNKYDTFFPASDYDSHTKIYYEVQRTGYIYKQRAEQRVRYETVHFTANSWQSGLKTLDSNKNTFFELDDISLDFYWQHGDKIADAGTQDYGNAYNTLDVHYIDLTQDVPDVIGEGRGTAFGQQRGNADDSELVLDSVTYPGAKDGQLIYTEAQGSFYIPEGLNTMQEYKDYIVETYGDQLENVEKPIVLAGLMEHTNGELATATITLTDDDMPPKPPAPDPPPSDKDSSGNPLPPGIVKTYTYSCNGHTQGVPCSASCPKNCSGGHTTSYNCGHCICTPNEGSYQKPVYYTVYVTYTVPVTKTYTEWVYCCDDAHDEVLYTFVPQNGVTTYNASPSLTVLPNHLGTVNNPVKGVVGEIPIFPGNKTNAQLGSGPATTTEGQSAPDMGPYTQIGWQRSNNTLKDLFDVSGSPDKWHYITNFDKICGLLQRKIGDTVEYTTHAYAKSEYENKTYSEPKTPEEAKAKGIIRSTTNAGMSFASLEYPECLGKGTAKITLPKTTYTVMELVARFTADSDIYDNDAETDNIIEEKGTINKDDVDILGDDIPNYTWQSDVTTTAPGGPWNLVPEVLMTYKDDYKDNSTGEILPESERGKLRHIYIAGYNMYQLNFPMYNKITVEYNPDVDTASSAPATSKNAKALKDSVDATDMKTTGGSKTVIDSNGVITASGDLKKDLEVTYSGAEMTTQFNTAGTEPGKMTFTTYVLDFNDSNKNTALAWNNNYTNEFALNAAQSWLDKFTVTKDGVRSFETNLTTAITFTKTAKRSNSSGESVKIDVTEHKPIVTATKVNFGTNDQTLYSTTTPTKYDITIRNGRIASVTVSDKTYDVYINDVDTEAKWTTCAKTGTKISELYNAHPDIVEAIANMQLVTFATTFKRNSGSEYWSQFNGVGGLYTDNTGKTVTDEVNEARPWNTIKEDNVDNWYAEDTTVLTITKYETSATLPSMMAVSWKLPATYGYRAPGNKQDLFDKSKIAYGWCEAYFEFPNAPAVTDDGANPTYNSGCFDFIGNEKTCDEMPKRDSEIQFLMSNASVNDMY